MAAPTPTTAHVTADGIVRIDQITPSIPGSRLRRSSVQLPDTVVVLRPAQTAQFDEYGSLIIGVK